MRRPPLAVCWERPSVIGIVNVTPDSFSDGGDNFDPDDAAAAARRSARRGRGDRRHWRRVDEAGLRAASRSTRSSGASCRCSSGCRARCRSRSTPRKRRSPGGDRSRRRARQRRDRAPRRPRAGRCGRGLRRVPLPDAHARRAAHDAARPGLRRRRLRRRGLPRGAARVRGRGRDRRGANLPRPRDRLRQDGRAQHRADPPARRADTDREAATRRALAQELAREAARRP